MVAIQVVLQQVERGAVVAPASARDVDAALASPKLITHLRLHLQPLLMYQLLLHLTGERRYWSPKRIVMISELLHYNHHIIIIYLIIIIFYYIYIPPSRFQIKYILY